MHDATLNVILELSAESMSYVRMYVGATHKVHTFPVYFVRTSVAVAPHNVRAVMSSNRVEFLTIILPGCCTFCAIPHLMYNVHRVC